jgi:hypothetical protein
MNPPGNLDVDTGAATPKSAAPDPREDDPSREGIFRSHNCWRCEHGAKPCAQGGWHRCNNPRARND